jgi:microcystin-dependent protein
LFGFGTWAALGAGRVLVGIDAGDTDFDVVEETGGDKVITLTSAQSGLPAHEHEVKSDEATPSFIGFAGAAALPSGLVVASATRAYTFAAKNNTAANASASHKNVPPYIVVYRWKRTA